MNGIVARVLYIGSGGIVYSSRVLITVAGCMVVIGHMIRGRSERMQVFGYHIKVRCVMVQLTSELWALSQSVPKMIS